MARCPASRAAAGLLNAAAACKLSAMANGGRPSLRRWRRVLVRPDEVPWLVPWLFAPVAYMYGWFGMALFGAAWVGVVVYSILLFRRWRHVEEYPERLHLAAPWLSPSPPFAVPAARADDLLQLLRNDNIRIVEVDTRHGQDLLPELKQAAGAASFWAPTREHLRQGHLLGELPRDRITAIVWHGAGCLAAKAPQTYADVLADLTELRTAKQPWQRIELFLVDDRASDREPAPARERAGAEGAASVAG